MLKICGLDVTLHVAGVIHPASTRRGESRYSVQGFNLSDGRPIKFKSLDRAERHVRNMLKKPYMAPIFAD